MVFFEDHERSLRFKRWLQLRILGVDYDELPFEQQRWCAMNGGFQVCVDQAFDALKEGYDVECCQCPHC